MRRSIRKIVVPLAVLLLLGVGLGAWHGPPDPLDTDENDASVPADRQSKDLDADRKLMWTVENRASPDAAIWASARVFGTVQLVGLTRDEVIARLGDPRATGIAMHSTPWFDVGWRDLVYRFDNGAYGYQFTVKFDWRGKVRRILRLGIE